MTPTSYLILWCSLVLNVFFIFEYVDSWVENKVEILENQKVYVDTKIFWDDFKLADYSSTKFTLEPEGIDIIKNAREFHSSPALIKWDAYDEYVCAWYVFELSRKLWDPSSPYLIGMMEQNTKTPADAWQLPYSYEYVGGKILSDFTWDFSLDTKDYWDKIDSWKLKEFFDTAFSEQALFGDIGFFYKHTEFVQALKTYKNANSHIVKNIGISTFTRKISESAWKTHKEIFSNTLSCDTTVFSKLSWLLQHYEMYLDDKKITFYQGEFYYLWEENLLWDKVIFKDMSSLSFQDITMMHFFEWANVDSLLEMTCQGQFFPINIMQINPRFIEKI